MGVGLRWHRNALTAALLMSGGILGACTSAGSSQAGQGATRALTSACQRVSAVLSDGPDPGADPVGYAEAQVLPLRQVRIRDGALERAVDRLSSAYSEFFTTNGAKEAEDAVERASHDVDVICPGAVS